MGNNTSSSKSQRRLQLMDGPVTPLGFESTGTTRYRMPPYGTPGRDDPGGSDSEHPDPADTLLSSTLETLNGANPPKSLDLSRLHLGAPRWAQVMAALGSNTAVTSVDVSFNQLGTDGGVSLGEALAANTTLVSLNASYTGLGAYGAAALVSALERDNSSLAVLGLENNEMGAYAGSALAKALRSNTGVTALNVAHNELGPALTDIVNALTVNDTLLSLNIAGNLTPDDDGAPIDARLLLGAGSHLRELDATDVLLLTRSPREGCDARGDGRSRSRSVTDGCDATEDGGSTTASMTLSMGTESELGPEVGSDVGSESLMYAQPLMWLLGNSCLTALRLGGNGVIHSAYALAEVIASNDTLVSLELDGSDAPFGSDPPVLAALGEALAGNTTLVTLGLPNHRFDATAGAILGAALETNSSLTALNLRSNNLGPDGGQALVNALVGFNCTLVALNVRSNGLGPHVKAQLSAALAANAERVATVPARPPPPRVDHRSPCLILDWGTVGGPASVSDPDARGSLALNWLDVDPSAPAQLVLGYRDLNDVVLVHALVYSDRPTELGSFVFLGSGTRAMVHLPAGVQRLRVLALHAEPQTASVASVGDLVSWCVEAIARGHGVVRSGPAMIGPPGSVSVPTRSAAAAAASAESVPVDGLSAARQRIHELEAALRVSRAAAVQARPPEPVTPTKLRGGGPDRDPAALAAQLDSVTRELAAMESRALAAEERLSALARLGKLASVGSPGGSTGSTSVPHTPPRSSYPSMGAMPPTPPSPHVYDPNRSSSRARLRLMVEMSNSHAAKSPAPSAPSPAPSPTRPRRNQPPGLSPRTS